MTLCIAILNPNSTASMTEEMAVTAREILAGRAELLALTNASGPASIQGPEDGEASLPGLYAIHARAVAEGAGAAIIGCFDDTGLAQLRATSPIPVLGLGEASCIAASLLAPRFSVVTTLAVSVPVIEENIRAAGLWPRCASVRASGVPVLELTSSEGAVAKVAAEIEAAGTEDGAGSVVLGCAGMTAIAARLAAGARGLRIVDPVRAAVLLALGTAGAAVAPTEAAAVS